MALVLKLSHNGQGLLCETEHGANVPLPAAPEALRAALVALLQAQAKPKVISPGVDGDVMTLVLAEWERVGRPGDGKGIRKARGADPSARLFTASGRELLPL